MDYLKVGLTRQEVMDRKTIAKIVKLLALAEGNDSVHQAAAARQKAEALMRKHDVKAEDLASSRYVVQRLEMPYRRVPRWYAELGWAIGRFLGAFVCYTSGRSRPGYWTVAGLKEDVAQFEYMVSVLARQVEDRVKAWAATTNGPSTRKARNGYRNGLVLRLNDRLASLTATVAPQKGHPGRALTVRDKVDHIAAWYKSTSGDRFVTIGKTETDASALRQGFADGSGLAVQAAVEGPAVVPDRWLG